MELRNLQARLTPRGPWQAMDLGTRMLRACWRPLLLTWLVFTAVPFAVLVVWLGAEHFYWALFLFWWLKPLWERPLLAFCARAVRRLSGPMDAVTRVPKLWFQGPAQPAHAPAAEPDPEFQSAGFSARRQPQGRPE